MEKEVFLQRIKRRILWEYRRRVSGKIYLFTFETYWHYLFNKSKVNKENETSYFSARPNIYAGIGHQMANWISGLWFAHQFNLKYAHIPFSTDKWEDFLGFGIREIQYYDLIKEGYKVRSLPKFDEKKIEEVDLIKKIIATYSGSKTILLTIQDQSYSEQYGMMEIIKHKFRNAPARLLDNLEYSKSKFNIAVHVRRSVIIDNKIIVESEENKAKRLLDNNYYENVLDQILKNIKIDKPIAIWLFSTGKPEEFSEFSKYGEVHFCSYMDEYQSFSHLIFADLLVTSKSSFSYKPALMNDGIKVCPRNFWHGYPDTKDWILCENDGSFDIEKLKNALK